MIRNQNYKTCYICHKEFLSIENMKEYLKKVHHKTEQKGYICGHCGNRLLYKRSMKYHVKAFHDKKESKFNYKLCDFSTLFKSDIQKHVELVHKEKTFDQCDLITKNQMEFNKHIKSVHPIKFLCDKSDFETGENGD